MIHAMAKSGRRSIGRRAGDALARLAVTAVLLCQAGAASRGQTPQDPLPDAPGKTTVVVVCASCHDVDTAIGMRRTTSQWKEVVEAMINRGAVASDDEFKAVLAYLSKNFGVVNVNAAAAKEIEDVLEISSRDAEAIVRYRMERGSFAGLDELKLVPGVDAPTIEKRKERVQFK
jgi:competence ComEA-like helix-hairpin-helix protein